MTRTFDGPARLVYGAWTKPELFRQWWVPKSYGLTLLSCEMDVRVGGTRLVCMEMTTPNGPMRMWFTGEFREIVTHRRLVYTESIADEHGNILAPAAMGMPESHPACQGVRKPAPGREGTQQTGATEC